MWLPRSRLFCLALVGLTACTPALDPPARPEVSRRAAPETVAEGLILTRWETAGPPRAVILALHGFGDSGTLAFDEAAAYWAGRGIAVYALDQRGFGGNASRRNWPGPETLVADAVNVSRRVAGSHPGLPIVVVGHSMGAGVALAGVPAGLRADGLVLAGPAIAGGDALNPVYRAGSWALAAALPEKRWTGGNLVQIRVSDNAEALERVQKDPRFFGDPSSRELYGLVQLMDAAAAAAPAVAIPTLTLMGAHDEVLRPDQVRRVHDRIPGASGYILYPDGWHWLFRDLNGAQVWADVADFALSVRPRDQAQPSSTP
jgi:alpha-beta hydrolase superfamily lysophospholipase